MTSPLERWQDGSHESWEEPTFMTLVEAMREKERM